MVWLEHVVFSQWLSNRFGMVCLTGMVVAFYGWG